MDRARELLRLCDGVLCRRLHSRAPIDTLLARGAVTRVFPGVYVDVDLVASRRTRYAAALAARPKAVLWGDSAVAVLTGDGSPFVQGETIVLAQATPADRPGLRVVKRPIAEADVRLYNGLRCPRAAIVAVEAAVRDDGRTAEMALREGLVGPRELREVLHTFRGSRGQETRERVIVSFADNPWSGGERQLQRVLRAARITGWLANVRLKLPAGIYYPDLLFERVRFVVEFDGFAFHSSRDAFEGDRIRQNALVLAGFRVLRFTWRRLRDDPQGIVTEIRNALAADEPLIA